MQVVGKSNNCHTITTDSLNKNLNKDEVELNPTVQKSLQNIILKEGFKSHKISKRLISTNGSNYMGQLYEIDVRGRTREGDKEIHMFLKHVIPGEAIKSLLSVDISYSNEVFFYNELCDIYNRLQENANVPEEEKFKIIKSYECNSDAIILENIARTGFKSLYRMDVVPIQFAELIITQLAKFHGLSFVLKHRKIDYFKNNIETIESPLNFDKDVWVPFVKKQFAMSVLYFNSDVQKKIDNFLHNKFIEKFPKYSTGVTESVKCLCHGDFRTSNVMVKEKGENNQEVVVIDYQFLFYRSPVTDIIHFIYTGTDRKFRKAHMNDLKDLYYKELTEFLQYFDLNGNDVYPREVYEKDFEDSLDYGLMIGLYVLPIIFTEEDKFPDFGKESINNMSFKMSNRHKDRITEIVEEYLENGILN